MTIQRVKLLMWLVAIAVFVGAIFFAGRRFEDTKTRTSPRSKNQAFREIIGGPFAELTDDELCDLLEKEGRREDEWNIVREMLMRKTPQIEARLRKLVGEINEGKHEKGPFSLFDCLLPLTALRRIQGRQDPLQIDILSISKDAKTGDWHVQLRLTNVDIERVPFAINSGGGPIGRVGDWKLKRSSDDRDATPEYKLFGSWLGGYGLLSSGGPKEKTLWISGLPDAEYYLEYASTDSRACAIRSPKFSFRGR